MSPRPRRHTRHTFSFSHGSSDSSVICSVISNKIQDTMTSAIRSQYSDLYTISFLKILIHMQE